MSRYTRKELEEVSVSAGFGETFGFRAMPTLEDLLSVAAPTGVGTCAVLRDVSGENLPGYEDRILPLLTRHGVVGRTVINSGNRAFLASCHARHPELHLAIDLEAGDLADLESFAEAALDCGARIVEYEAGLLRPDAVAGLHRRGLSVWA